VKRKDLPQVILYAHLAFLVANLIWGAAGPVIKYTLEYIPPTNFLFIRFLLVCIIILPYMVYELKKHKVDSRDYFNLFLLGTFSQTSILITFWALEYTTALESTVIGVIGTIATIYLAHKFYHEEVDRKLEIGLGMAILGTFFIIIEPILQGSGSDTSAVHRLFGNILALTYTMTWVIFIVWSKMTMGESSPPLRKTLKFLHLKPMHANYPPTLLIGLSFYVGLLTLTPLAVLEKMYYKEAASFHFSQIDPHGWAGLLYMTLLSSICAYTLNQWALHKAKVTDAAVWTYIGTVFVFPVAYVLLGEVPNTFMLAGGVFIAAGVLIAESRNT
jgi:drug/metabolite transporter (DMT)-like permease